MKKINIPLCRPSITRKEIDAVVKVLKSGWLAHGPVNEKLEEKFRQYFSIGHCTFLNSGASALLASLLALDLKGEVLLPSFTFSASANVVVLAGLKPVFCEIDWQTGNLDPEKIEEKIGAQTVAIMPVHFAGQPCKMDKIMRIASRHELKLIEDSAECLGGKYKDKYAGTFGDAGCFSFWATKNITCGEGGGVISNNKKLIEKIRLIAAHGIGKSTYHRFVQGQVWLRDAVLPGFNFRLSDILAAIALEQFKRLTVFNRKRRRNAKLLTKLLSEIKQIETPFEEQDAYHVYQMYVIKVHKINRLKFIKKLKEQGIGVSVHFDPPVHQQTFYRKNYGKVSLPVTEELAKKCLTLPMFPDLTIKEIKYMASLVKKTVDSLKK